MPRPAQDAPALSPAAAAVAVGALGRARPSGEDVQLLWQALRGGGGGGLRLSQGGFWGPLLEAGLPPAAYAAVAQRGLPGRLRPLDARSPVDARRLSEFLRAASADGGDAEEAETEQAAGAPLRPWDALGALLRVPSPAALLPLHRVLAQLGALGAAAAARTDARRAFEEAAARGSYLPPDGQRARTPGPRDLAALEWAGVEWHGVDDAGRSPLHLLCAHIGQNMFDDAAAVLEGKMEDSALHLQWAVCGRWLVERAPASLLRADGEGLTPLNYLTPPLSNYQGFVGSARREFVCCVAEGLARCASGAEGAEAVEDLDRDAALRIAAVGAGEFEPDTPRYHATMPLLLSLAGGETWDCAFTEWRQVLLEARGIFAEADDAASRIRVLRRFSARARGAADEAAAEAAERRPAAVERRREAETGDVGEAEGVEAGDARAEAPRPAQAEERRRDVEAGVGEGVEAGDAAGRADAERRPAEAEAEERRRNVEAGASDFDGVKALDAAGGGAAAEAEERRRHEPRAGDAEAGDAAVRAEAAERRLAEAEAAWERRREALERRVADLRAAACPAPLRGDGGAVVSVAPSAPDAAAGAAPGPGAAPDARIEAVLGDAQDEAHAAVARIRRLRLVDVDLAREPPDVVESARKVRASLLRAVERLATDLYELESHFVYELLQNADDNRYAEAGRPTLRFSLRACERAGAYFFSANNELGVRVEDVVAICDVSASSKVGKRGVTGQKGIGWKSCFQVSDCPHMLSGAFTFKFDVAGLLGELGYVTPTWVDRQELARLPPDVQAAHAAGQTVIYLPLRMGVSESVAAALEHLEEHHTCLLFMRRLALLEVVYPDGREARYHVAERQSDPMLVRLSIERRVAGAGGEGDRLTYLMHHHPVALPPSGQEELLSLAFLQQKAHGDEGDAGGGDGAEDGEPPLEALYCGPPVRRVGFRFAVNGPFELVASRGDIHEGSAVNRALCDALPLAFAGALRAHEAALGPHALSYIGRESVDAFWRRARGLVMASLQGEACMPTEDGGLAAPAQCVLRPRGALAAAASKLVPAEVLMECCGLRFAEGPSGARAGEVGGLGMREFGLDHWLAVLRHRSEALPSGLAGAAGGADAAAFFGPLFAWLDEELSASEQPGEILQSLWSLPLLPSASSAPGLLRLCDGPILLSFCDALPAPWQQSLCDAGALRVLDGRMRSAGARAWSLLSALCVADPSRPLIAGMCLQWHLLRFPDSATSEAMTPPSADVVWASLACLMEAFHAGELEAIARAARGPEGTPIASTGEGRRRLLRDWRGVGSSLWLPTAGSEVRRPSEAVAPSFLGVPAVDLQQEALARCRIAPGAGSAAASAAVATAAGLRPPCRFIEGYLDGRWGDALRWEAFLSAIGALEFALVPPRGAAVAATSPDFVVAMGSRLVDAGWWTRVAEAPRCLEYVRRRVLAASPEERAFLQGLRVTPGAVAREEPRRCCLAGLFLHSAWQALGGRYLPYVRLPPEGPGAEQIIECLEALGVTTSMTLDGLVAALESIREGGCRDCEFYAELYRRVGEVCELGALADDDRAVLARAILVPGRGFVPAASCTWEDTGLLQWLAEVPALEAHYGRYGPCLRRLFVGSLGVLPGSADAASAPPAAFGAARLLTALRRLVGQVDIASRAPDEALQGAAVDARALLRDVAAIAADIYRALALACAGAAALTLRSVADAFDTERLILLQVDGRAAPKRLLASEAWWDVAEDLGAKLPGVAKLALVHRFGEDEDLKHFFTRIAFVRSTVSLEDLRELLRRPLESDGQLSHWEGFSVADIEDIDLLQTSSDFRPPGWRPPDDAGAEDAEEAPAEGAADTTGGFQPPSGSARVPAWRSRAEAERDAAERAQREELRRQRHEERQQQQDSQQRRVVVPQPLADQQRRLEQDREEQRQREQDQQVAQGGGDTRGAARVDGDATAARPEERVAPEPVRDEEVGSEGDVESRGSQASDADEGLDALLSRLASLERLREDREREARLLRGRQAETAAEAGRYEAILLSVYRRHREPPPPGSPPAAPALALAARASASASASARSRTSFSAALSEGRGP